MKRSYQISECGDSRALANFLAKEGQLLLPMFELIEQAEAAIDELIDVMGRATIEAVLLMSAEQVAGSKTPGEKSGEVRWHGSQGGKNILIVYVDGLMFGTCSLAKPSAIATALSNRCSAIAAAMTIYSKGLTPPLGGGPCPKANVRPRSRAMGSYSTKRGSPNQRKNSRMTCRIAIDDYTVQR